MSRAQPRRGGGAMGKAFAAWLMIAGAVAAPTTGPRETVESAVVRVGGVLQKTDASGRVPNDRGVAIKRIARGPFDFDEVPRRALPRPRAGPTPAAPTE